MSVSRRTEVNVCSGRDCYLSTQEVVVFETLLLNAEGVWRSVEQPRLKGLTLKATD